MVATALAVLGCSLLIAANGSVSGDALGVVSALGAGASYATYTVASKGLLEERPPDAVTAVVFCIGAVLLSPLLLTADLNWLAHPRGLAVALHLGLIATAAAYVLFARGLIAVPVATAVTLSLAEPLTAGILGVVVLGERLTISAMLGIGLLCSGLTLLSRGTEDASEPIEPTSSQLAA
jgi:DME family drug/metabolite transporter